MSKRVKQYLMLFAALGVVAVALGGGSGTFAGFNAVVANQGNYFKTGTLFLHDTAGNVTCTSESATNNENIGTGDACHTIFAATLDGSGSTKYYAVALKNAGTLDASHISVYSTSGGCTPGTNLSLSNGTLDSTLSGAQTSITIDNVIYGAASGTALDIGGDTFTIDEPLQPGTSVTVTGTGTVDQSAGTAVTYTPSFGTGNLCTNLDMQIVETDNTQLIGGAEGCAWGTASGLDCVVNHDVTLDDFPTTIGAAHQLTLSTNGGDGNTGDGLDADGTRYFLIAITPDATLDNTYQNKTATVDIAWNIDQA